MCKDEMAYFLPLQTICGNNIPTNPMRAGWHRPLWMATTVYETANCADDPRNVQVPSIVKEITVRYFLLLCYCLEMQAELHYKTDNKTRRFNSLLHLLRWYILTN